MEDFDLRGYLTEGYLQKETTDNSEQFHRSRAYREEDPFIKQVRALMKELDKRMDEYLGLEDTEHQLSDREYEDLIKVFAALKKAYEGLNELVNLEL